MRTRLDIYVFIDDKSVYMPGGNSTETGTSGLDKRKIYEYGQTQGIYTVRHRGTSQV